MNLINDYSSIKATYEKRIQNVVLKNRQVDFLTWLTFLIIIVAVLGLM